MAYHHCMHVHVHVCMCMCMGMQLCMCMCMPSMQLCTSMCACARACPACNCAHQCVQLYGKPCMPGYGFHSSKAAKGRNSGVLGSTIACNMRFTLYFSWSRNILASCHADGELCECGNGANGNIWKWIVMSHNHMNQLIVLSVLLVMMHCC